jgi:hypothetical protein
MRTSGPTPGSGRLTVLSTVDAGIAVLAVWGGISLMLGAPGFRWPVGWLEPLGLDSWVVPGAVLTTVVGGMTGWAAVTGWRGTRHAPVVSLVAAVVLLGWLLAQVLVLEVRTPVQVATAVADLLVIVLACGAARRRRAW